MENLTLYRKRFIPDECIHLKDDQILYKDDRKLITKWIVLKPRKDFHHGCSCYFFNEGIKISKFYREDGSFLYWYCDIVRYSYDKSQNALTIIDLLADVIVYPDGKVKVMDVDELSAAREDGIISDADFFLSVKNLGFLLASIENGRFYEYGKELDGIYT